MGRNINWNRNPEAIDLIMMTSRIIGVNINCLCANPVAIDIIRGDIKVKYYMGQFIYKSIYIYYRY